MPRHKDPQSSPVRPGATPAPAAQLGPGDKLLKPQEVADMLQLNVGTLRNWRAGAGSVELPFVKLGRGPHSIRYRLSDVEKLIQSRVVRYTTEWKSKDGEW